ncbi:hypothetical protein ACHAXM_004227, partial [Skeletonema potamos]
PSLFSSFVEGEEDVLLLVLPWKVAPKATERRTTTRRNAERSFNLNFLLGSLIGVLM